MATTTTTTTATRTTATNQNQIIKPKRRNHRETTIFSTADGGREQQLDPPTVVSSSDTTTSWCCPASSSSSSKPISTPTRLTDSEVSPSSSFRIRFSPGSSSPVMDFGLTHNDHPSPSVPSSFTKFNNALTAGLLNPMSPPPPETTKAATLMARSSPTLFEMMAIEPESIPVPTRTQTTRPQNHIHYNSTTNSAGSQVIPMTVQDRQSLILHRISDILGNRSPGNLFNDPSSSDVRLTLSSKDGISVSMNVHRQILVAHSRFFAVKLSGKGPRGGVAPPCSVEIADCDDVEVYIETLRLMYCKDLRRKLMREDVCRVLGILKVSAAIGFDAGVLSCLEFLEAAPWAEDEEEKVASLLAELRLEGVGAGEVLKRVSVEVTNGVEENGDNEEVLLKLLSVVLEGKDEKARREMKGLVSKMLRENSSQNDLRKESLYTACDGCLQLLRKHFLQAASGDLQDVAQIARQADNLHWILDILIDRQIAEDFLKTWAAQSDLSDVHSKIPSVHRHEISTVTARLFVGIGKGQVLASKEARCLLLQTWLVPFYDDFGWMRRASKGLDRHLIEDGLSNTILTLPLAWQQEFLVSWFNRFLNSGEDCPNIQRGFEVWWRRAFWKRSSEQESVRPLRIINATVEKS